MHVDNEPETIHVDTEPETQIPSNTTTIPHPETLETVSEIPQENLNPETIIESQPAYPLYPIAVETISTSQTITTSQPLTMDELVIPSDQMLPLLESLTRHFIFIDDQFEPPRWTPKIDIRNIKIKPLKRKKPEPKLPYREPYPTLNQNFEPNVELLSNAINISLKNFLRMEEEAFIFPSDVDAEIRALKPRFSDALEVLSSYLKEKIKGRGVEILSQVMDFAEHAHAPRLTNYNHEEDRLLSEQVFAAIQENVRQAFEEAKRIAAEEAEAKARRIASEEEVRKLADRGGTRGWLRVATATPEKIKNY
jgi:hypothetical protein